MGTQCSMTLLRSSISAVNQNDGTLTHAYYQQNDSSISVIYKDGPIESQPNWGGGDNTTVLATGKAVMGTPLATIHWQLNGKNDYRTYYLSPSFQICENVCSNGPWVDGDLNKSKITAAPYSKLSAIVWLAGGSPHIRVYYQGLDDKIHEICYENGWATGSVLPGNPLHGTSLAFVQRSRSETPSIRGYYQENDRTLMEVAWEGRWTPGTHIGNIALPYRTAIAACVPPGAQDQWMRVYYLADGFSIAEFWWHGGWNGPAILPFPSNKCVPDAQMAAVSFFHGGGYTAQPDVRIYVQQPSCLWNEVSCTKGTWAGSNGLAGVPIKIVPLSGQTVPDSYPVAPPSSNTVSAVTSAAPASSNAVPAATPAAPTSDKEAPLGAANKRAVVGWRSWIYTWYSIIPVSILVVGVARYMSYTRNNN